MVTLSAALRGVHSRGPNLAEIGRLLLVEDLDERLDLQDKAAFQVARELGLMR
jgi:hypothetical protein